MKNQPKKKHGGNWEILSRSASRITETSIQGLIQ
uniref:Uncharacterized protein n=1 Tax=Nelumbo nucifera TaxID=4432 RepID=A0A822YL90_NELNU|nr:TPA_asm: hypothetical protein HUJ06_010525 [Nelumbo nucifera]DAD31676.1 TPA_asm: hypothetical protein HUJ06_010527 [Nelumbo nucifera]